MIKQNHLAKKIAVMLTASVLSTSFIAPLSPVANAGFNIPTSILLGMLGGNKIGDYTTYTAMPPSDWKVMVRCVATNEAARYPISGKTGKYTCQVQLYGKSNKYALINSGGTQTASMQFNGEEGDNQSTTIYFPYLKLGDIDEDTGKRKTSSETFPITITATLQPETATTTITRGVASNAIVREIDIDTDAVVNNGENGIYDGGTNGGTKTPTNTERADTYCSDGSYWCPEDQPVNDYPPTDGPTTDGPTTDGPTIDYPPTDGPTNQPKGEGLPGTHTNTPEGEGGEKGGIPEQLPDDGKDKINTDIGDTDIDKGVKGNTNLPDQGFSKDPSKTYSDLINDLLDDNRNDSYNSTDPNWAWSNPSGGNSGNSSSDSENFPNLDDYFNGTANNDNIPSGLTTDDTGLAGIDDGQGGVYGYDNGDGGVTGDGGVYGGSESGDANSDVNLDYIPAGNNYYGVDAGGSNSSGKLGDWDAMPEAYQQGLEALGDSLNGDNSNLLGDMTGANSFGDKLGGFLGNNKILGNNRAGTASDQNLYDMAKKWLLANGYSADDIANGRNYDANSAYTEPSVAWDMNRITTLLKGKKISLTSPTEVKKKSGESTLQQTMKAVEEKNKKR